MLRTLAHIAIVATALAILTALLVAIPQWVWHPDGYCATAGSRAAIQGCKGYNLWSGILGSFLTSLPGWIAAGVVYWYTHNCHEHGCWRLVWHVHPDHGHPVCKKHHPHDPRDLAAAAT